MTRIGKAGRGEARCGAVRIGATRQDGHGKAGQGEAGRGPAGQGPARYGRHDTAQRINEPSRFIERHSMSITTGRISKAAAERINELAKRHNGNITPDIVVEDAKNTDSPLHGLFEWDVEKAAMQHWIETARWAIRQVRIVVNTDVREISTVAYVRNPSSERDQQGYRATLEVPERQRGAVIAYELERIEGILKRTLDVAEVYGAQEEVKNAIRHVVNARKRVRRDAA